MSTYVFLDLEKTLVDNWQHMIPIHIEVVQKFMKSIKVSEANILSFAIWNKSDKERFETYIEKLNQTFDFKIIDVLMMDDFMSQLYKYASAHNTSTVSETTNNLLPHFNKSSVFKVYTEKLKVDKNNNLFLIDDSIETVLYTDSNNNMVHLINVNALITIEKVIEEKVHEKINGIPNSNF